MMNVALRDHESARQREGGPAATASEIDLGRKLEGLREMAQTLLRQIDQLEGTIAARGTSAPRADLHTEVQRFESEVIRDALRKTGGHQRRAARLLGVKVSTLNAKIRRYGIRLEEVVDVSGLRLVGEQAQAAR